MGDNTAKNIKAIYGLMQPLVSIIVINYNGRKFIEQCLEAIINNNYENKELLIIDNNSTDGSPEIISTIYKKYSEKIRMRIFFLKKNYGPNIARNIGIKNSSGDFCLFVDHDAILTKDLIDKLIHFLLKKPSIGAVQPLLILLEKPNMIDTCGYYLTTFGFVTEPYSYKPLNMIKNKPIPILGGRGVFMIRKSVLEKIGLFDESYFLGWDESELFWRIWLAGYKVFCYPMATAYHVRSSSPKLNVEGLINGYKTFIKYLELKNLIRIVIFYSIALIYVLMMNRGDALLQFIGRYIRLMREFRVIFVKRRLVQLYIRKMKDVGYLNQITARLSISELLSRAKRLVHTKAL